jgi:4-carboxymuconolactone decarboxylase
VQTGKLGTTAKNLAASLVATAAVALAGMGSTPAHAQGAQSAPPAATPGAAAQQTPAQRLMGDIAPKLADLTDTVLFGDVWERPGLSKRDRSLATVSALVAMNRPDQLRSHLAIARKNGVTEEEFVEAITHLAFYAGWPSAVTAVGIAREVFQKK